MELFVEVLSWKQCDDMQHFQNLHPYSICMFGKQVGSFLVKLPLLCGDIVNWKSNTNFCERESIKSTN